MEYFPLFFVMAILGLIILARWPGVAMVVIYPLFWTFWTYSIPGIGRIERLIGLIGIAGLLLVLLRQRISLRFPTAWIPLGIILFIMGYLVAWLSNPGSIASEFVGITLRIVFLSLAYFHIRTRSQINQVGRLFVFSGLFACTVTLIANISLGFGYIRIYGGPKALMQHFGLFAHPAMAATFATAPAVLLLATYSQVLERRRRFVIILFSLYLLWMAFVSQYRRELLVTIILLLILFVVDQRANLKRPAWTMLTGSMLFFFFILLPNSSVLQYRLDNETVQIVQGTETRILNFKAGMKAFFQRPLGYGPGVYESAVYNILGSGYHSWEYHSYNVFTSVAVEGGVISLLGICIFLSSTLLESLRWRESAEGPEGWILRSAPGLLAIIFIWFMFGNAIDVSLPWYMIGLILSAVRLEKENKGVA